MNLSEDNIFEAQIEAEQTKVRNDLFERAPKYVVVELSPYIEEWWHATGTPVNHQHHHETLRAIFDLIDFGFPEFQNLAHQLPLIANLVENSKFYDIMSNENSLAKNLHSATFRLATGVFFSCHQAGIFFEQRTPFLLDHVHNATVLLFNPMTREILTTT